MSKVDKKLEALKKDVKIVTDKPLGDSRIARFIAETEGKENKGGDPRLTAPIKNSLTAKEQARQTAALERLRKKGFKV